MANIGEPRVQEAIEDLYAEDADWNLLIPELSAKANSTQMELADFLDRMQDSGLTEGAFDLALLRPKTSTVIYSCPRFLPKYFRKAISKKAKVRRSWISRDRDLAVFITSTALPIDWAHVKDVNDDVWDLFILGFDRDRSLLFVHSSSTTSLHANVANAVSGNRAVLLNGERMFRALSGFSRLVFQNVGLYGRGKLRFRMYTGYDVSDAIAPTTQAGGMKSNIFGVGYENGRKGTIGVSNKGRLWSMASSSIPEWRAWCDHVATKVLDDSIPTDMFLAYTLLPTEITALPASPVLAVLLPDEWLVSADRLRLTASTGRYSIDDVGITGWTRRSERQLQVTFSMGATTETIYELSWSENEFHVSHVEGMPISVEMSGGSEPLSRHLSENPPILLLADGSEVRGIQLLAHSDKLPLLFDQNQIRTLNWTGVPITVEAKWRNGVMRPASVQGKLIDERVASESTFVIDDDDPGESADVVEILQGTHEVLFRLYHCKFSHGAEPGVRVSDLYEVCGQAVRSSRLVGYPELLLTHLEKRERPESLHGRPTRFEKGTLQDLRKLRRRIHRYRCRFEIAIVQPGLRRGDLTPEASTLLASADSFIREFTGTPLVVYASS